ncbi:flagellar basal-body rod protein FlgG [Lachnospiraceae bacterium C7]|nr:flagellar basal-body rod protein FlgG [Lachnospiraceae bacterium C7]
MMRALYTAASGMIAEQTNVDTISNNLANVNTNGFKTERTEFKSLLYQTLQTKTTTANGENKPVGAQVGLGTRVAATTSMYTQGAMLASDSKTDFCLDGDGFFAIRGLDGETYYTRNGNFTWSVTADGRTMLANHNGEAVLDAGGNPIYVPEGVASNNIEVSNTGKFSYKLANGNLVDMNQSFGIYQFNNPQGLEKLSDSLLRETVASGNALQEGVAAGLSPTKVRANYLEGSNVQVADEMVNLIIAQRAYELNSKAITTSDSMLDTANNLKR